jgi:hypothetical protein
MGNDMKINKKLIYAYNGFGCPVWSSRFSNKKGSA